MKTTISLLAGAALLFGGFIPAFRTNAADVAVLLDIPHETSAIVFELQKSDDQGYSSLQSSVFLDETTTLRHVFNSIGKSSLPGVFVKPLSLGDDAKLNTSISTEGLANGEYHVVLTVIPKHEDILKIWSATLNLVREGITYFSPFSISEKPLSRTTQDLSSFMPNAETTKATMLTSSNPSGASPTICLEATRQAQALLCEIQKKTAGHQWRNIREVIHLGLDTTLREIRVHLGRIEKNVPVMPLMTKPDSMLAFTCNCLSDGRYRCKVTELHMRPAIPGIATVLFNIGDSIKGSLDAQFNRKAGTLTIKCLARPQFERQTQLPATFLIYQANGSKFGFRTALTPGKPNRMPPAQIPEGFTPSKLQMLFDADAPQMRDSNLTLACDLIDEIEISQ